MIDPEFVRAVVMLLAAVVGLIVASLQLRREARKVDKQPSSKRTIWLCVCIGGLLTLSFFLGFWIVGRVQESIDTYYTRKAFVAFENEDWDEAADYAKKCIKETAIGAASLQDDLTAKDVPVPKAPWTPEVRERIFTEQGVVNNVAACYWILGRISEEHGDGERAKEYYAKAAEFTHGVVWDKRYEGFWSVADEAQGRLKRFEAEKSKAPSQHPVATDIAPEKERYNKPVNSARLK
jgi:tetratricopeptide (TPR) repeat protein